MKNKKNFYITTPIYYPNAKPHIGSLYTTLLADVFSRTMQIFEKNLFFLTGTDEHGQKVFEAAEKEKKEINLFLNEIVDSFKENWKNWNINYSIFMRTTNQYHQKAVCDWIILMQEKGFIYKSNYEGWYSKDSESFLHEKDIFEKNNDGIPLDPVSKKPAIWIKQEAYFFKLSAFQDKLLKFYENNQKWIILYEKMEEIVSFVRSGLKDLCISRSKKDLSWGIPFPNDSNHVVYVWADALNNYITAIGYLQKNREEDFNSLWPADLQILGKDISRFHAVYWPAFLMASDLELPKNLLVHGWILVNNEKMSKSLGNVIDPNYLLEKYGLDKCRYFLIRHFAITQDCTFSYCDFEEKTNAELCDNLGNLIQRVLSLIKKNNNCLNVNAPEKLESDEENLYQKSLEMLNNFKKLATEDYMLHKAYHILWSYIDLVNAYIHKKEPWKLLTKNDYINFEKTMSACLHAIRQITFLIWPIMPETAEKIANLIGLKLSKENLIYFSDLKKEWNLNFQIKNDIYPIFEKIIIEKKIIEEIVQVKKEENSISFDYFLKTILRVGEIIEINEIKNSDKLYEFKVDFGNEVGIKTICSGIKKYYKIEELKNIKVVFIENLEPRKLCGTVSEGMILTVENNGIPQIIKVDYSVKKGTRLK